MPTLGPEQVPPAHAYGRPFCFFAASRTFWPMVFGFFVGVGVADVVVFVGFVVVVVLAELVVLVVLVMLSLLALLVVLFSSSS